MKINLRQKILLLTLGILVVLGGISTYILYDISVENSEKQANLFYDRFNSSLEADRKALEVALTAIMNRNDFQQSYIKRDREKLLEQTKGYFEELKTKFSITHFYFHNVDSTNFLRVHKPLEFGDTIKRATLKNAIKENKMVGGLETGKTAFAYRVISPVYRNNQLIGYQEVGQEIDNILEEFKKSTNANITFMMKDNIVDKAKFKEEQLYNNSIIYASTDTTMIKSFLDKMDFSIDNAEETTYKPLVKVDGKYYFYLAKKFQDASGKTVGDMIITGSADEFISGLKSLLLTIGILTLVIVGLTIYVTGGITKPVEELLKLMEKAKEGNLVVQGKVSSNDEIGKLTLAFNAMVNSLRDIIGKTSAASEQLAAASEELTATSEETTAVNREVTDTINQLSAGTTKQAEEIESTRAAINQMSIKIGQVANNTEDVSKSTYRVLEVANSGSLEAENAVNKIERIKEVTSQTADAVKALGDESERIGQIVDVIKGIADQTNLLALNAAIEAARAGEQGRGFAVVAEEVRKLAEQSSASAQQIAELITNIQHETNRAVGVMEVGTKEVDEGVMAVNKAGESFVTIVHEVNRVVEQIKQVSGATQEIVDGNNEVVNSVENIASISQQTASATMEVSSSAQQQSMAMEEVAKSAQDLTLLAEQLQNLIVKFKY